MGRAAASVRVPGPIAEVEALWYDVRRWPSFVEGFHAVVRREGDWPREGARIVWDSVPQGRGRVAERVLRHEPRVGQEVEVEDPRLRGVQRVAFAPADEAGSRVTLELEYALKQRSALTPLLDRLFVRRAVADALRRTLSSFAVERAADAEL